MRIAEIFDLGYGSGGWDYDDDGYSHRKHRKHRKYHRHYDDDDSLIDLDIDL